MEIEKKQSFLSNLVKKEEGKLKNSPVWFRTDQEDEALEFFRNKVRGYRPQHEVQKKVIQFADTSKLRYKVLSTQTDYPDVDRYIKASGYWTRDKVTINDTKGQKIDIIYASNKEMMSVICKYKDKFIITTNSSFDNILRETENVPFRMDKNYRVPSDAENLIDRLNLQDIL